MWPETVQALEWAIERRKQNKVPYDPASELFLTKEGATYTGRTLGGNGKQRIANLWAKLIARVQLAEGRKKFRKLPAKSLRKTAANFIRQIAGGEVAGVFLAHGSVCGDDLAEAYSNRPFAAEFDAIEKFRAKLNGILSAPEAPAPAPKKKSRIASTVQF